MVAFEAPAPPLAAGRAEDRKKVAARIAEGVKTAPFHEVDQALGCHHGHDFRVGSETQRRGEERVRELLLRGIHLEKGKPFSHPWEMRPTRTLGGILEGE